jgi:hypothetical protein
VGNDVTRREMLKAGIAATVLGAAAEAEAQGLRAPSKTTPCSLTTDPGPNPRIKLGQSLPNPFYVVDNGTPKCLVPGNRYKPSLKGCHMRKKDHKHKKVRWSDAAEAVAEQAGSNVRLLLQAQPDGTEEMCPYGPPFKGAGDLTITLTDVSSGTTAVSDTPVPVIYDE